MDEITSDLAKKSGDHPRAVSGGSPNDFRRDNIAGPHGPGRLTVACDVNFMS